MNIGKYLKCLGAALALVSSATFATTLSPITLLNPTGSSSGQAIVSTGASSAPAWGGVGLNGIAAVAANTVLANATGSSASPTAFAMPSCSTSSSALNYTSGTGIGCNSAINAATLGGATFAAPGPIGSTTASTGAFTTLSASGVASLNGGATTTTAAFGNNSTNVATTAFVATHTPCKSIMDYGGNNGGTVDNSTAFSNTVAASPSGQVCVYFPPGTYAFSSQFVYSLPTSTASITIQGAGADVSILKWAAGGGFQVNYSGPANSARIRNLSIVTGTTATGNGLVLFQNAASISNPANSALSEISGVAIHGSDGYAATNYWSTGIYISGVSNVNIVGSSITGQGGGYATVGTGISITGASAAQGVQYNIIGSVIQYVGTGILYNNFVQGVAVAQSNFTGDNYGIAVNTPANGQDQLTVTGSQFNCGTTAIYDQIGIAGLSIYGNYIIVPYTTGGTVIGVQLSSVYGASITSNVFQRIGSANTNTNGLVIQGGSSSHVSVVTGNIFENLYTGVWLNSSSGGANVQSNAYAGNTNANVLNQGTGNTVGGGSQ